MLSIVLFFLEPRGLTGQTIPRKARNSRVFRFSFVKTSKLRYHGRGWEKGSTVRQRWRNILFITHRSGCHARKETHEQGGKGVTDGGTSIRSQDKVLSNRGKAATPQIPLHGNSDQSQNIPSCHLLESDSPSLSYIGLNDSPTILKQFLNT